MSSGGRGGVWREARGGGEMRRAGGGTKAAWTVRWGGPGGFGFVGWGGGRGRGVSLAKVVSGGLRGGGCALGHGW